MPPDVTLRAIPSHERTVHSQQEADEPETMTFKASNDSCANADLDERLSAHSPPLAPQ